MLSGFEDTVSSPECPRPLQLDNRGPVFIYLLVLRTGERYHISVTIFHSGLDSDVKCRMERESRRYVDESGHFTLVYRSSWYPTPKILPLSGRSDKERERHRFS